MAAAIVLDASVTLAWFLEGDSEQQRSKAQHIGELIAATIDRGLVAAAKRHRVLLVEP